MFHDFYILLLAICKAVGGRSRPRSLGSNSLVPHYTRVVENLHHCHDLSIVVCVPASAPVDLNPQLSAIRSRVYQYQVVRSPSDCLDFFLLPRRSLRFPAACLPTRASLAGALSCGPSRPLFTTRWSPSWVSTWLTRILEPRSPRRMAVHVTRALSRTVLTPCTVAGAPSITRLLS
ncbi:hypothetical protein BJ166DRAFT_91019 [Pestalotiopsis sp. NC0098]|nr:hypothetical protein BJ166DRAFT_91019 [Pestalotiopsis sp. NC0098]